MRAAVLHFAAGAIASLLVFVAAQRLSGATSFSLPSAPLVIGIACATMGHFATPWATPAIVLLYAIAAAHEVRADREARHAAARPGARDGG